MSPSPAPVGADNVLVTQSPGVGASGVAYQYADGKAAKVSAHSTHYVTIKLVTTVVV